MNRQLKRVSLVVAAVALVALPLACGEDDTGTEPGPEPVDTVTVMLTTELTFDPANPTISPGDVIEWIDESDNTPHTVTPDGHSEWDSQDMPDGGDPFLHKFENVGTFPYYCIPHQADGMEGTITVEE